MAPRICSPPRESPPPGALPRSRGGSSTATPPWSGCCGRPARCWWPKLSMVELAGGMGYDQANASWTGRVATPGSRRSGAAVARRGRARRSAAGLVGFAIGTETWGSITNPSGHCGVSGLRPTYGRVSRSGAMALAWTLDKIGPMARSAHDCALISTPSPAPTPTTPRHRPAVRLPARRHLRRPVQARHPQGRPEGGPARGPRQL